MLVSLVEVEDDLGLDVLRVPPWTLDGTLSPFAFEAADLNASKVSEPEALVRVRRIIQYTLCPRDTDGGFITPTIPAWQ